MSQDVYMVHIWIIYKSYNYTCLRIKTKMILLNSELYHLCRSLTSSNWSINRWMFTFLDEVGPGHRKMHPVYLLLDVGGTVRTSRSSLPRSWPPNLDLHMTSMRLCFGQARQENVLSTGMVWRLIQRCGLGIGCPWRPVFAKIHGQP